MSNIDPSFLAALSDATVFAPELPEIAAFQTLEAITRFEQQLVVPKKELPRDVCIEDYELGTARVDDDIRVFGERRGIVLATADHATNPVRKDTGVREGADHGTGGLVHMLASYDSVTGLVPVGRQTGNANVDVEHPFKDKMDLWLPGKVGFLSVHGMRPAKLTDMRDPTEIHAVIGLGSNPNDQSLEIAEQLVAQAKDDFNLRLIIGNHTRYKTYNPKTDDYIRDEQGEPKLGVLLAAKGEGSTTNHAYRIMARLGITLPALQIEMTRVLRAGAVRLENGPKVDKKAEAIGVYLGYLLTQRAVKMLQASR